jgi:hypothetical protein
MCMYLNTGSGTQRILNLFINAFPKSYKYLRDCYLIGFWSEEEDFEKTKSQLNHSPEYRNSIYSHTQSIILSHINSLWYKRICRTRILSPHSLPSDTLSSNKTLILLLTWPVRSVSIILYIKSWEYSENANHIVLYLTVSIFFTEFGDQECLLPLHFFMEYL